MQISDKLKSSSVSSFQPQSWDATLFHDILAIFAWSPSQKDTYCLAFCIIPNYQVENETGGEATFKNSGDYSFQNRTIIQIFL